MIDRCHALCHHVVMEKQIDVPRYSVKGFAPKPVKYYIDEHDCWICISHYRNQPKGRPMISYRGREVPVSHFIIHHLQGLEVGGLCVLHSCDNPMCINPDHLHLGTQSENMREMRDRGRAARMVGENSSGHKLTEQQVAQIRSIKDQSSRQIAIRYGVGHDAILDIKNMVTWKHV